MIFSGDGDRKTVVGGEAVNCKFPVWCKFDYESQDAVAQFFLEKYWPFCWDKNPFTASVEVCGARNKGSVNGSSSGSKLNVVVYPSDAFTMKLSIPPWRKTHSERAGAVTYQKDAGVVATTTTGKTQEDYRIGNGSSVSGTESGTERSLSNPSQLNLTSSKTITTDNTKLRESIETKEGVKGGKVLISEEIKLQERDVVLTFEEDTDEGKKPIVLSKEPTTGIDFEITRNGQALETAVKVRELLNTVKYLEYNIKQVFNSIKDFVPQVGWKMGLDISLFSGTLEGSWSYKEHTDHRVFMYYAIEAKLKIVEVGLDLSFGISVMGGSIQAVLIGKLEGAVEFVSNVERDSPDTQAPDKSKTGFNGSIDGSLSGQAALGYGWFKIERKAGISFGVEIFGGLKIEEKEGFYLEGNGKFKPIKFFAYCDDGINGKSGKEYILTEEKDLFSGRFPEGKTSSSVPTTNKVPTVKTAPPSGRSARVTKPKKP